MKYWFFTSDEAHHKSCDVERKGAEDYPNVEARKIAKALANGWRSTVYFCPDDVDRQKTALHNFLFIAPDKIKSTGNFTPFQAAVLQKLNNIERNQRWASRLRLNRVEAAEYLGVSVWTLDKLRKEGHIRPVKLTRGKGKGARLGYLRDELDRYLRKNQLVDPTTGVGADLFEIKL